MPYNKTIFKSTPIDIESRMQPSPPLKTPRSPLPSGNHATVTIYGDPGSGKKTLISLLNQRLCKRPEDKKTFIFDARLGAENSPSSIAIVLCSPISLERRVASYVQAARQTAPSVCAVQTKMDLIPRDYSEQHIQSCLVASWMGYTHQLDCFDVSLTAGDGIDELLAYLMESVDPLPVPRQETWVLRLRRFRDAFLDCIAAWFALPTRQITSDLSSELSQVTSSGPVHMQLNSEMDGTWTQSLLQRLHIEDVGILSRVHRISHSLLAKMAAPSEGESMDYVHRHTSIPIPRSHCPGTSMMVMDLIDGEMLWECWDKLSVFARFRIACTLRLYVKQMRSLRRTTVGAVDTGYVSGILFGQDFYGPFDSLQRFRHFCEYVSGVGWRTIAIMERNAGRTPPPLPCPKFDWTPVFTHGDLNMSNVLRDRQGTLWLLDWEAAGFYPACMESVVMWNMDENMQPNKFPASWSRYRSFIAGAATEDQEQFWYNFYSAIHRFPGKAYV